MSTDFAFGPFVLDTQRGQLLREGLPASVSSKGLRLLEAFLASSGRVLTKTELMQEAWGDVKSHSLLGGLHHHYVTQLRKEAAISVPTSRHIVLRKPAALRRLNA